MKDEGLPELPELWWSPGYAAAGDGELDGLIARTGLGCYRQWRGEWLPIAFPPEDAQRHMGESRQQ